MAAMAAQVPALFEALSGMQMSDLLGRVKSIGDKTEKAAAPATDVKLPVKQPTA